MYSLLCICLTLVLFIPSVAHAASLDVPSNGDKLSGIGVLHGWKCTAEGDITIEFDAGGSIPTTYGFPRGDTGQACGDDGNNGFYSFFNWAILGDGEHTAVAYDNGVEFARSTFTVTTTGEEFLTEARARVTVENFPAPGETTVLEWNQSTQHFEIVELRGDSLPSYDRAYWRQVNTDLAAGTFRQAQFLYAEEPAVDTCQAGKLTQAAKNRAHEAMNQIRALHDLAPVQYSSRYDRQVQEAALIQAANGYLTHFPDPSSKCYTEAGAEASGTSSIYSGGLTTDPANHLIGWTNDAYNSSLVAAAGHRRWMLNPFSVYVSYGQVHGYATQKVFGFDSEPNVSPRIEVDYVAFPYETYPFNFLEGDPPWSFSVVEDKSRAWDNRHPYFESATVRVTRASDRTSLTITNRYTDMDGFGVPNFLSWNVEGWEYDTLYQVEIDNVAMQGGGARDFSYQVYIDRAGLR